MISWWYCNSDSNDVIIFFIQFCRNFTQILYLYFSEQAGQSTAMKIFIEKIYEKKLQLKSYSTVLLFVTDAEIVNQLLYVKQLMKKYHNYKVKTKRIALFWEMSSEHKFTSKIWTVTSLKLSLQDHLSWIQKWMNDLIYTDYNFVSYH